MNGSWKIIAALALGLIVGALVMAYGPWVSEQHGAPMQVAAGPEAGERQVLYWYDPMVPDQHFDKPGKSPFMDMDLVPKYADEAAGAGVSIDPRTVQSLGIRTTEARTGRLWRRIDTVGYVAADENRIRFLQTRVSGWIEHLSVHALNDPVRKGQLIAEIFSPDLYAAQEEYLLAMKHPEDAAWRTAARDKLIFLGLSRGQIEALERGGQPQRRVAYHAPVSGMVSRISVHPGASVSAGMPLLEISDLSRVWVLAEVAENQMAWIAPGKSAEIAFTGLPGEVFEARVEYVYPSMDAVTRTVKVRLALDNPGLRLKPGMFANVTLYGGKGEEGVIVPREAVIQSGRRAIVLVAEGEGRFMPVEVTTGMESGGETLILAGLTGQEQVVTSGQFLIESEANLTGALARMAPARDQVHSGTARIVAVDPGTGALTMEHDPIPALQWPAMTMDFQVRAGTRLEGLKPGQAVVFDMVRAGDGFEVTEIRPAASGAGGLP